MHLLQRGAVAGGEDRANAGHVALDHTQQHAAASGLLTRFSLTPSTPTHDTLTQNAPTT